MNTEPGRTLDLFEQFAPDYLAKARNVAFLLYRERGSPITVDDVREIAPPPADLDPRVMGAIFRSPDWKRIGYVQSRRKECHHRLIAEFVLRSAE